MVDQSGRLEHRCRRDNAGFTFVLFSAAFGHLTTTRWLVEHGGADATVVRHEGLGSTIWSLLHDDVVGEGDYEDDDKRRASFDAAAVTAFY